MTSKHLPKDFRYYTYLEMNELVPGVIFRHLYLNEWGMIIDTVFEQGKPPLVRYLSSWDLERFREGRALPQTLSFDYLQEDDIEDWVVTKHTWPTLDQKPISIDIEYDIDGCMILTPYSVQNTRSELAREFYDFNKGNVDNLKNFVPTGKMWKQKPLYKWVGPNIF